MKAKAKQNQTKTCGLILVKDDSAAAAGATAAAAAAATAECLLYFPTRNRSKKTKGKRISLALPYLGVTTENYCQLREKESSFS